MVTFYLFICSSLILLTKQYNTNIVTSNFTQLNSRLNEISTIHHYFHSLNQLKPNYSFIKIQHTVLSLSNRQRQHTQEQIQSIKLNDIHMLNSINIHDDQITVYPVIINVKGQYYSIKGKKIIINSNNNAYGNLTPDYNQIVFISTAKSQFTYFAHITNQNNITVSISKLLFSNKKSHFQKQLSFQIGSQYGNITDFCNAFIIGKKMYAFGTDKGYLLFYKNSQFVTKIAFKQNKSRGITSLTLKRLNNNLLAYSSHQIKIIQNSNPKPENIKQCRVPLFDKQGILEIKYDIANWQRFFVMTTKNIYVYQYHETCSPVAIYPLALHQDQPDTSRKQDFMIAGDMLIISILQSGTNYYYNTTDHSLGRLLLPKTNCPSKSKIDIVSKSSTNHLLCDFCLSNQLQTAKQQLSFSCYLMQSHISAKIDPADYSKMRVPLILISLAIIIYVVITRNSKNDSQTTQQGIYEQLMNKSKIADSQQNSHKFSSSSRIGQQNYRFQK